MSNSDKKISKERRKDERYNVALDIEWSADSGLKPGRLHDVSSSGCYVLAGGEFSNGEVVRIYFPMTDGTRTELVGEITNHEEDIGFAVRFVNLKDTQRQFLQNFAELHQNDLAPPIG
jgi:hypothetical protein